MNKSKIEWTDYTWNPVTGCLHGCPYCYAKKTAENPFYQKAFPYGFAPHFYPERLQEPAKMKKPQTIFVCSMADLFGEWVRDEWIRNIFSECAVGYQHTYIFLTKNPSRYLKTPGIFYLKNMWFGATVDGVPNTNGYYTIPTLQSLPAENKFISFEPLLRDPGPLDLTGIKQVIIGAQTKPSILPDTVWIRNIQNEADRVGAKVFCKDSLSYLRVTADECFSRDLCWSVHK